jgi:hypothetical protein
MMFVTRFTATVKAALVLIFMTAAFQVSAQDIGPCADPGNPVVAENCNEGSDEWIISALDESVVGFVFPPSVDIGEQPRLYLRTPAPAVDIEIYRIGYYGGKGARLILSLESQAVPVQPECNSQLYDTGLISCANWTPLAIPAEPDWISGVYVAKMTREDTGGANHAVFVIRDDARSSDVLLQQSNFTFHAYNNYGGKSVYDYNSGWDAGYCNTVSLNARAAKVSLFRPYAGSGLNNFFDTEYPLVRWMEQQGYDVTYATNWDVHRWGEPGAKNELLDHSVFISAGHDEYWSQNMSDAVTEARDAGVHLAFLSANTRYWRVRVEDDPWTGTSDAVVVVYKTTENGAPDPSGHATSTFRDPDSVNSPENSLLGTWYIGDNVGFFFPLRLSAEYADHPLYRHTGLQNLSPGTFVDAGDQVIGWEWGSIVDNGLTPENLEIVAETPVIGFLLQDAGNADTGTSGYADVHMTRYIADSGAQVFSTGTILWAWGLGAQGVQLVPVDPYIQQITYNMLADMGVQPASSASSLILDGEERELPLPAERIHHTDSITAPRITDVQVDTSGSLTSSGRTALFRWQTDVPARGQVWLGEGPDNTHVPVNGRAEYVLDHAIQFDGLIPGTTYYYRIAVIDQNNRFVLTDEGTFVTPPNLVHRIGAPVLREWRSLGCWNEDHPYQLVLFATFGVLAIGTFSGWRWRVRRRKAHVQLKE